ncbi:MAG: phosphoribosylformylglycinamidine synthase subunit PurQ, partial [Oscillospiraceae bacterium]|nr:phosphoribosylformylglycinamidine synthase subunit PurQ [Oscillospiraceae bacterium]
SPYHGAMLAVIESVAKVLAAGGTRKQCWLTFQEYFERTQNNPKRWGKPFSALLGAFKAQLELTCASIGGKDSMSGTFEQIDVPPTLVSFAVSVADTRRVVSTEFKGAGHTVIRLAPMYYSNGLPDWDSVRSVFDRLEQLISDGRAKAIWTVSNGGVAEGIAKMALGNHIGFEFTKRLPESVLFRPMPGSFLIELDGAAKEGEEVLGRTTEQFMIFSDAYTISLETLRKAWEGKLESVFPCRIKTEFKTIEAYSHKAEQRMAPAVKVAKPRVLIPVFPGTNCEYDTAKAFSRAGAVPEVLVIRNLSASAIEESVEAAVKAITNAQMIMIPGGFSGGDEPDGSGKFITAFFRNPKVAEAVHKLLKERDGLMLGICNGFQALVKLGLVPYGEITEMSENSPTLTFNTIARHQSMMVTTRIASNKSPWLAACEVGDIHTIPISHGEGRFIASGSLLQRMANNGQIATQYVDLSGRPTMDIRFNPNSSVDAIEGITSPDGRVLGKMGHSERIGDQVCKNVPGEKDQRIFESGVRYFAD